MKFVLNIKQSRIFGDWNSQIQGKLSSHVQIFARLDTMSTNVHGTTFYHLVKRQILLKQTKAFSVQF